ncbi:MAG: ATP-binding cassette domain-containing protein, partial [Clostridia bacterium]|nr:ATP-binding cassette domain-containing protein [Clostridia bacterium]
MENMIEVKNVSMRFRMANDRISSIKEYAIARLRSKLQYNEFEALKDVSFDVRRGEVVGLIGHNGAGKSTVLKVVSGI